MSSMPATWSLCSWVKTNASKCCTFARNIWYLKSGPESITTVLSPSTKIDERSRLSRLSDEVHTSQPQAITGTPCDVPVPKKVMVTVVVWFV